MRVTVAICPSYRASLLRATLDLLTRSTSARDFTWEVVVVDNGCTDDTPSVLGIYRQQLPLRPCVEPRPGLSHARNRAIAAAAGEYMLWTDDDVLVHPEWIAAYVRAFRRYPKAAFFGGPVAPAFQGQPPSWIVDGLSTIGSAFALRDFGERFMELSPATLPFGANFAIRADVQRQHLYDTSLGRQRGRLMVGEETEVLRSVLASGETGWWVPDARVEHVIPPERQRWGYLSDYWYAVGFHAGRYLPGTSSPQVLGKPRWLWKAAIRAEVRYRVRRVSGSKGALLQEFASARMAWGRLHGFRSRSRDGG